jgi:NIPSNAP
MSIEPPPNLENDTMIRALTTGLLLLTAWMVPARANDETTARTGNETTAPHRVFELRTYYTNEGKLTDLHKRFRDHTCRLLKQHGAELIGFWTPLDEKDGKGGKLIYLVAFPSREAAKKTWGDFQKDPEWQKVYKESHTNGALVNKVDSVYMEPTDYSETK